MAQQTINVGAAPNDGTGTPLRTAFQYTNSNFSELYTAVGPSGNNIVVPGNATITGDLTVDTSTLKVDTLNNRVGIVNASPLFPLDVSGSGVTNSPIRLISASGTNVRFDTGRSYTVNRNWIVGCDEVAEGVFTIIPSTTLGGSTFTNPVYRVSYDGIHTFLDGAGGTRMTLNSTGLGVGASPGERLTIQTALTGTTAGSNTVGRFQSNGSGYDAHIALGDNVNPSARIGYLSSALYFWTNGAERVRIDASGNLLVGTTSNSPGGTQSQFVNEWSGGVKWGSTFNQTVSSATSYTHIAFCTNGTVRGSIDANNTTITYGTVSDYRLKENVQPISNALTRIAALKPSTYKWKDSGTDGEGFIAHELASVVPLAVIGQKDALNEDGSIKAQQVDLSKVVPILVAAIQELAAEVNALKNA